LNANDRWASFAPEDETRNKRTCTALAAGAGAAPHVEIPTMLAVGVKVD
jgi:hypothetical protein